jgi:flagellar basal body-associated protein FliL
MNTPSHEYVVEPPLSWSIQKVLIPLYLKSSSKTLLIFAVLAATGAVGTVWLTMGRGHNPSANRSLESSAPKYLVHLEGFTVNLADPEEGHFLRVTMDVGTDRLPEGADREKPTAMLPVSRIRDAILSVLTVCKADELLLPEGKLQLKKNIVRSLNQNVPELGAREVYFTEFLVQR